MVVSLLELILTKKTEFFRVINKIFRNIKQPSKKPLTNKISTRLLGLEFKSDNITKSKAITFIAIKVLLDYK